MKEESQQMLQIITYPSDTTNIVVHGVIVMTINHLTLNSLPIIQNVMLTALFDLLILV